MLNFNISSGGSSAYIRYMASTSSWQVDGEKCNLKQAIFDLENITTGWCKIEAGTAPEWVMDADLRTVSARPEGDGWKRGFKVNLYSKSSFGDEPVREWGTNSTGAQMGIQALYAQFEKDKADNDGKVPVVEYDGAEPTKIGKGMTNVPNLTIVKWVSRPEDLNADAASPTVSAKPDDIEDEF